MDRPIPKPSELDQQFWAATKQGKLLLQRCTTTGRYQWYPRAHSLFDPQGAVEWVESSGLGEVHTFTVVHRSLYPGLATPYVLVVVRLREGVLMTGHLRNIPDDQVRIGQLVRVAFENASDDIALPVFEPDSGGA